MSDIGYYTVGHEMYSPIDHTQFTINEMADNIMCLTGQYRSDEIDVVEYNQLVGNWAAAIINKTGHAKVHKKDQIRYN